MLALSRRINESIMLGKDVEITILEIKGDQVKIGVVAPRSVPVYRKEIFLQIEDENRKAVAAEQSKETIEKLLTF